MKIDILPGLQAGEDVKTKKLLDLVMNCGEILNPKDGQPLKVEPPKPS